MLYYFTEIVGFVIPISHGDTPTRGGHPGRFYDAPGGPSTSKYGQCSWAIWKRGERVYFSLGMKQRMHNLDET